MTTTTAIKLSTEIRLISALIGTYMIKSILK